MLMNQFFGPTRAFLFSNLLSSHHVYSCVNALPRSQIGPSNSCARSYFRSSRQLTLYEILKVEQTASTKQIKTAYIIRSKEVHPDLNPRGRNSHKEFIRITEAYRVLRSPYLRLEYDRQLKNLNQERQNAYSGPGNPSRKGYPKHVVIDPDEIFGNNTSQARQTYNDQTFVERSLPDYYGIKGVKRMPNRVIVFFCFGIVLLGVLLHFASYQFSVFLRDIDIRNVAQRNAIKYSTARNLAGSIGEESTENHPDLDEVEAISD